MAAAPPSFFCPITYELMVDPGEHPPNAPHATIRQPPPHTPLPQPQRISAIQGHLLLLTCP